MLYLKIPHEQTYFLRARGPALHSVLTKFLALYVQPKAATIPTLPSDPTSTTSTASTTNSPVTTSTGSGSPSQASTRDPAATAAATALALQKCQQLNHDLKSRIEKLSTENSTLEEALEEKTDKALDAWAVAQEKYEALEEITKGMHVKMASQEDLITKLKSRVLEVC
jgi:hypothetical protein